MHPHFGTLFAMGRLYRFLTFRDPLWHAFCYGSQLPKFNTLRPTLARFLLCVCATPMHKIKYFTWTQHQELIKVKNENNLCAYACMLEKSCIFAVFN